MDDDAMIQLGCIARMVDNVILNYTSDTERFPDKGSLKWAGDNVMHDLRCISAAIHGMMDAVYEEATDECP